MSEISESNFRQEPIDFWLEFEWQRFGLHHHAPQDFFRSQWQSSEKSYYFLTYRWFLAIISSSCLFIHISKFFVRGFWFIYITHWVFALNVVTTLSGAIYVSVYHIIPQKMTRQTTLIQIYWACSLSSRVLTYEIFIVYWLTIFPYEREGSKPLKINAIFNIFSHVMPSIFSTVDHMTVAHPTRMFHFIYPVAFAITYLIFAMSYYFAGGRDPLGRRYIYKILDFHSRPIQSVVTVGMVICIMMSCTVLQYFLYRLRVCIARRFNKLQ